MSKRSTEWRRVSPGEPGYPDDLARPDAPASDTLTVRGDARLLRQPLLAFFCSVRVPGGCVLAAYDAARSLRDSGIAVIGGFQSPLERECLSFLLRGRQPVVVCPARAIESMRISTDWHASISDGRLLVLSAFTSGRRPTMAMAEARNRLVAALAARVFILHATPGGRLLRLADETMRCGTPVYCLDIPENEDLRLAGAISVGTEELIGILSPVEKRRVVTGG